MKTFQYWTPPVPSWKPLKRLANSGLRIACVLEDKLYRGLRFEAEVMLLLPLNWKYVLKYGRPDFLLMESIWDTATGHWYMGQCPSAQYREELLEIVAMARKLSIPTVFWITKGHEYHEHYKNFARYFDHVFCADPREVELLVAEGIQAELLLPCVQPAVYNPFRLYEYYDALNLGVLYDGLFDLDRMPEELEILTEVKSYGLNIIESGCHLFGSQMNILPDYKDCILGCVKEQSRIIALKYAKVYTTLDRTLSTKTKQQWTSLEAAASRLPVVHYGTVENDDARKGIVIECPEQMEFLTAFVRFREDELYRERMAHLGWRNTTSTHTFSHRIQKICKTIGIKHDWQEYPKASLIIPTFCRDTLPLCLEASKQQTYPNKELIIVFNSNDVSFYRELGEVAEKDVKIINIPGQMSAEACLKQGRLMAEGKFYFRMDGNGYYGPNYISDMILQTMSIDPDFFGKLPVPLCFENDDVVYTGRHSFPLCIFPGALPSNEIEWLGGDLLNSQTPPFQELSFAKAGNSYPLSLDKKNECVFAVMDSFNFFMAKKDDNSTHTGMIHAEEFKKNTINFTI